MEDRKKPAYKWFSSTTSSLYIVFMYLYKPQYVFTQLYTVSRELIYQKLFEKVGFHFLHACKDLYDCKCHVFLHLDYLTHKPLTHK